MDLCRTRVIAVAAFAALLASPAAAEETSTGARARTLLGELEAAPSKAARTELTAALIKIAPRAMPELEAFLHRPHKADQEARRILLRAAKASVPDKDGRFETPKRQKEDQIRADDDFNWLAALDELEPKLGELTALGDGAPQAFREAYADVATIRALAATAEIDAARIIVELSFEEHGLVYRDECGRYLRAMAPVSIPALTIASQVDNKKASLKRYATYQLERLDRQEPSKAIAAAADDEGLKVAILDAFRETHHREAVHAVMATTNDVSPRVRAAARKAWMAYVTGPPPPPAPKKKLALPGGKLTDKEQPLWLTYRELAEIELRTLSEELLGEEAPTKVDLAALSEKIFAHYDAVRGEAAAKDLAAVKSDIETGKLAEAVASIGRLLAANPDHPERELFAGAYQQYADQLADKLEWMGAAEAYSNASALFADDANKKQNLAAHYYALGKALEAEGADAAAAYRRAIEIDPSYAPAKVAAAAKVGGKDRAWMLYVGGGAAAVALLLLVVGLVLRRRSA